MGLLFHKDSNDIPASTGDVKIREEQSTRQGELYTVPLKTLPAGVKERILPPVVEEIDEEESVDGDGSLHESHKVWRIKEPAGFSPKRDKSVYSESETDQGSKK